MTAILPSDYQLYWEDPFPEGAQQVYLVGGNQDTSCCDDSLYIVLQMGSYTTWKAVFQDILDRKETFDWSAITMSFGPLKYPEDHTPEEYLETKQTIDELSTPEDVAALVVNTWFDPTICVREHDVMFLWLKDTRGWFGPL